METKDAYNSWAKTYDKVENKTRDLEAKAIRTVLDQEHFARILEIGCGTGKNTGWLAEKSDQLTGVDFSVEMLELAKQKLTSPKISFRQGDITQDWTFGNADLVTCSLVLEHIENIFFVFQQAALTLDSGGKFYSCELHPYKQLQGSRAKFEHGGDMEHLDYYIHHISDYLDAAKEHGFICDDLREWFDDEDRSQTPRLISFLFNKQ